MFKLIDKKILTILWPKSLFTSRPIIKTAEKFSFGINGLK